MTFRSEIKNIFLFSRELSFQTSKYVAGTTFNTCDKEQKNLTRGNEPVLRK